MLEWKWMTAQEQYETRKAGMKKTSIDGLTNIGVVDAVKRKCFRRTALARVYMHLCACLMKKQKRLCLSPRVVQIAGKQRMYGLKPSSAFAMNTDAACRFAPSVRRN